MNSIGEDCNELKTKYDSCFNSWFTTEFLRGNKDDSACTSLFNVYQKCVQVKQILMLIKNRLKTSVNLTERTSTSPDRYQRLKPESHRWQRIRKGKRRNTTKARRIKTIQLIRSNRYNFGELYAVLRDSRQAFQLCI